MERHAIRIIQMARQSGLVEAVQLELVSDSQAVEPRMVDDEPATNKTAKLPRDFLYRAKKLSEQGLPLDEIANRFGISVPELQASMAKRQSEIEGLISEIFKDETPHDKDKSRTIDIKTLGSEGIHTEEVTHERKSKEELIIASRDSFRWFCEEGLVKLIMDKAPIRHSDRNLELDFIAFEWREPVHTASECRKLGLTYACPLYVKTRLLIGDTGEIKEQDLYLADIPLITQDGTFIIDGVEQTSIIDSLTNRSLGQSLINQGLEAVKSTAIRRMSKISLESATPSQLIDVRPLRTAVNSFFSRSR